MKQKNKYNLLFILCLFSLLRLEAQVDLQTLELNGSVRSGGKGIANVLVTDGINVVKTDTSGKYSLLTNATAEFVYISVPAGYQIPISNNSPCVFYRLEDKITQKQKFDFDLVRLRDNENRHNFVVWADPQVYTDADLMQVKASAEDLQIHLQEVAPQVPSYGIVAGDIVGNANIEPLFFDRMKQIINSTAIPFFYTVGNHDITYYTRSDRPSKKVFKDSFGPTYYSFDRGEIHYIVLDNCFYAGNTWYYIGYIPEEQLAWLEQDLSHVEKGKTIIVTMHIPAYSQHARRAEWAKEKPTAVLQNRSHLFKMFEGYNVHVLSGHTHEAENYIIQENIFEHNHPAICGLFYEYERCKDGTPQGYTVYEIDGSNVKWYYKAVGKSKDYQFTLYGVGEHHEKIKSIVVNVWNYDPQWRIQWYEDGKYMGDMEQFTGVDTDTFDFVEANRQDFKHTWASASPTDHLFFATPTSAASNIKVEVIDRFGNVYIEHIKND